MSNEAKIAYYVLSDEKYVRFYFLLQQKCKFLVNTSLKLVQALTNQYIVNVFYFYCNSVEMTFNSSVLTLLY